MIAGYSLSLLLNTTKENYVERSLPLLYFAAIQGERDKIGYTKRRRTDDVDSDQQPSTSKVVRQYADSSTDQSPMSSNSPNSIKSSSSNSVRAAIIDSLMDLEAKCNKFRLADIELESNVDLRTVVNRQTSIINDDSLLQNIRTVWLFC